MKNKLGVIVPYRNRSTHLDKFLKDTPGKLKEQEIDFEIIVVEQADDKPFNRGKLLNIGVKKAKERGCTYVALHDVDMIPLRVDYSSVDRPTHLATHFTSNHGEKRIIFDEYFGGVTLFPILDYYKVNGYSNEYWGWGYEDDDLMYRCRENYMDFNTKQIPVKTTNSAGLVFNGWDSQVKLPKPYHFDNFSILITFEPDKIECDEERAIDEYSILSVPGYDMGFSYNSFKRYKFETFTTKKECISLKSVITEPKRTTLMVVVDQYNKFIKLYQDGELIDEHEYEGRLLRYDKEKFIYLGQTPSADHNARRPYKGRIDYLAFWNHSLEPGQVNTIFENLPMGVLENYEGYTTSHCLEAVYDAKASTFHKLIDLSGNNRHGKIHHCDRTAVYHEEDFTEIAVPWRKEGRFLLLPHADNGFYENKWIYTETRKNQVRFYNKVLKGKTNWRRDGMDTLKYKLMSETNLGGDDYKGVMLSCQL